MNTDQDVASDIQLFTKNGKKFQKLDERKFKHESELQHMIESNMYSILGIEYINSELRVNNFRIDTVGFDRDTKSFVIIEYKRDKSYSVVDQGTAYLNILKENQANFVLEYNKKFKCFLENKDFDWEQSKVIIIARTFNAHQKQAANKPDLRIELYEIRRYSKDTILLNTIHKVKKIIKKPHKKRPKKNQPNNTLEIKKMVKKIENNIMALNVDIQTRTKKFCTVFKLQRNFAWVEPWKNSIDITFSGSLHKINDPKKMIEDVSNIGHHGGGNLRIKITEESQIPHMINIIEQILKGMKVQ